MPYISMQARVSVQDIVREGVALGLIASDSPLFGNKLAPGKKKKKKSGGRSRK